MTPGGRQTPKPFTVCMYKNYSKKKSINVAPVSHQLRLEGKHMHVYICRQFIWPLVSLTLLLVIFLSDSTTHFKFLLEEVKIHDGRSPFLFMRL